MGITILNKIMFLVLFLSIANVFRHFLLFVINATDGKKYVISNSALFYLGLSISFILTSIFTGIRL